MFLKLSRDLKSNRMELWGALGRDLSVQTLFATTIIFAVLEIWRPYYFLTDDNLTTALPFLTEMGRHLKSGQSPFYSDYLFGGHYDLLRDVSYFSWSPVNFLVSLLSDTSARFAMCDILAFFAIMLSALGFSVLSQAIRKELKLSLTNSQLLFLTLSFVFSSFILTAGASWVNVLANQAALPWLAYGLWQTTWRRALGILTLFSLYQALTGYSAGTISNGIFVSLFALVICVHRRSFSPMGYWAASNLITILVIFPILLPALGGFLHSERGGGLSVEMLNHCAMPAKLAPFSFLFGNCFEMAAYLSHAQAPAFFAFPRMPTLLACAAAWCVFPLVCQYRRWTLFEGGIAALIALLTLMIIRPTFITDFMTHVPILRCLRWPFREILQLLFFFHLLLVVRPWAGQFTVQNRFSCFSLAIFLIPFFFTKPLSFNPFPEDRAAILSGRADELWAAIRAHLRPGDELATVIDPRLWDESQAKISYVLTGTADFPAYYRIPCISGYSQTIPLDQLPVRLCPYFWFGAYKPSQVAALRLNSPNVRLITVTRIEPLGITLSPVGRGEPAIDLTPYLPR